MLSERERIVISVGGSLLVPDTIDTVFISRLREFVFGAVEQGFRFYIVAGGGKTSRRYGAAVKELCPNVGNDALDWLGIAATRLNAELLRATFSEQHIPPVILDTQVRPTAEASIYIAGGVRPGNSSDKAAVDAAKAMGAKKLVNLSNVDYVYTADPRTNTKAKKVERANWDEFRALLPTNWSPNLSSPFDPVAAKEAQEAGLEVAIINGTRLEELEKYMAGKPFTGTVIS